jgi:homoserine O-acetyltransferase
MAWHQLELHALDWQADGSPGFDLGGVSPSPSNQPGGLEGLSLARAIALLSYGAPNELSAFTSGGIGASGVAPSQQNSGQLAELAQRLAGLRHQHPELSAFQGRFDAFSYQALCRAMTQHDLGRYRGGVSAALERIGSRTVIVSIATDLLFPPSLQDAIHMGLRCPAELYRIHSSHGHDGFLLEHQQIAPLVRLMLD